MIFKARSFVCFMKNKEGWSIVGDVSEILTETVFLRKTQVAETIIGRIGIFLDPEPPKLKQNKSDERYLFQPDKFLIPFWEVNRVTRGDVEVLKVPVSYLSLRNGTHLSVVFHEAYLLNDEGKTIERL